MLIASSVRPAPMSPASPTISPRRTVKLSFLQTNRSGDLGVTNRPILDLEEDLTDVRGSVGKAALQASPDHAPNDAVFIDLVLLDVERLDRLAVAQDRDRVSDLLDLVELVADDDRT